MTEVEKKGIGKKKIALIIIGIIVVVFIIGVVMMGGRPSKPVANITNVYVLKEGELYTARFSLEDKDIAYTTSDGDVSITIVNEKENVLYHDEFSVKAEDFKTYKLKLTGAEFWAYAWTFPVSDVSKGEGLLNIGKAEITFTTPESKSFTGTYELVFLP